jgi:hypothetical protein
MDRCLGILQMGEASISPFLNPHSLGRSALAFLATEPLAQRSGSRSRGDAVPANELAGRDLHDAPASTFNVDALSGRQIDQQRIDAAHRPSLTGRRMCRVRRFLASGGSLLMRHLASLICSSTGGGALAPISATWLPTDLTQLE